MLESCSEQGIMGYIKVDKNGINKNITITLLNYITLLKFMPHFVV